MVAALRRGDLPELSRLSHAGTTIEFERGARYRLALFAVVNDVADPSEAAAAAGNLDAIVRIWSGKLESMTVREIVAVYHGRFRWGDGISQLFHLEDGNAAAINAGDVLAYERLDADA